MGNHFLSGIVRAFKVIPRLYDKLRLKGSLRKPFYSMIENDEDCKRLQAAINQGNYFFFLDAFIAYHASKNDFILFVFQKCPTT